MNLIVSPHIDDEVLGAYSFLRGSYVYFVGIDESKVNSHRPDLRTRIDELREVSKFAGFAFRLGKYTVNEYYKDLNTIIKDIEDTINELRPDTVLIPNPNTNQDHRTVYEACMVALRPHDKNHFVKNVLIYEGIEYNYWGESFQPNYFKSLNLWEKNKAYKLYRSLMRDYRSTYHITRLAELNGCKGNMICAEGFKVVRLCQDPIQ